VEADRRQRVGRRLQDVAIVVHLPGLGPVGGRAAGRRERRRFEGFTQVREDLPDRPRVPEARDQPEVAAAPRALPWKLLAELRYEFRPRDPRGVMGSRFVA
jgi:hypothetical protein